MINFAAEIFCANIDMICFNTTVQCACLYTCTYHFARDEVLDVDILKTEEALILFVGDAHSPKVTLHEMALSCKLRSRK